MSTSTVRRPSAVVEIFASVSMSMYLTSALTNQSSLIATSTPTLAARPQESSSSTEALPPMAVLKLEVASSLKKCV